MLKKGGSFACAIRKLEGKHTEPEVDHAIHRGLYRDNLPNGGRVRFLVSLTDVGRSLYPEGEEREVAYRVDTNGLNGCDAVYVILRRD